MSEPVVKPLEGRGVLVTGASSGIGRAIAVAAARAGADVALTYRSNASGARETEAPHSRARPEGDHVPDRSGRRGRARLARRISPRRARPPRCRGSTMRARTSSRAPAPRCRRSRSWICCWRSICAARCWRHGRRRSMLGAQEQGGVIINMSWDHVLTGMAGTNPQLFAAVKGGVLAFSKSLARSVAPRVRVNVLAPGWIETSFAAGVERAAAARLSSRRRSSDGECPRMSRAQPCFWRHRPPHSSPVRRSWWAAAW